MSNLSVREIIERIAAGLRAMKMKPDAFVFIDAMSADDMTWDERMVCGLPVFHGQGFLPPHYGSESTDCPFVPVWHEAQRDSLVASKQFVSGYSHI